MNCNVTPRCHNHKCTAINLQLALSGTHRLNVSRTCLDIRGSGQTDLTIRRRYKTHVSRRSKLRCCAHVDATPRPKGLPGTRFVFPKPRHSHLMKLVLTKAGATATTLVVRCRRSSRPLPRINRHSTLISSDRQPITVLIAATISIVPLKGVASQRTVSRNRNSAATTT